MRDKERFYQLSLPVLEVYFGIEEQILLNIARRLRRADSLIDDDILAWQAQALSEFQALTEDNMRLLARSSGRTDQEIRRALQEAGYGSLLEHERVLQEGVRIGALREAPPLRESSSLLAILESYQRQARQKFNLINTTMLNQSQRAYLDIVNRTTGEVMSGAITHREALRKTVQEWAQHGVPALIDRAGKEWSTEAYVSMVMRSTSNNVANEMQQERFREYDVDLIEVSSYEGARPKCAEDQGKIYSLSGRSDKYPPFSSTSYGEPDGLFGINCSHTQYPYIEGLTARTFYPTENKAENDRIYKESQQQRYLERQVRLAKREEQMMKALGDDEGAQEARRKVLDSQARVREFVRATGRTRRYDREQIY